MGDLKRLVHRFTIQEDRFLKKLSAPLENLGISHFCFYTISNEGRFGILSTYPEQLEYYYTHDFYLRNPYLVDPGLLTSGVACVPTSFDPESFDLMSSRFKIRDLFLIQQHTQKGLDAALFFSNEGPVQKSYLEHLFLLTKFISYFKQSAEQLLLQMEEESFDLKQAKGASFFAGDRKWPLSALDPQTTAFLKQVSLLSKREQQCLDLYKNGWSAQATAAFLGLSRRTVETYFESIKNKLGCSSKSELLTKYK